MSWSLVCPATGFLLKRELNSGVGLMPICYKLNRHQKIKMPYGLKSESKLISAYLACVILFEGCVDVTREKLRSFLLYVCVLLSP